jgi:hypothetical protein
MRICIGPAETLTAATLDDADEVIDAAGIW